MDYFEKEASLIQTQTNRYEFTESESTNLYHHALHKKRVVNSAILELDTDQGPKKGHDQCTKFIEDSVSELLNTPFDFDLAAQTELLKEVEKVFTDEDNEALLELPDKEEIHKTLQKSNLYAAPGSDGITGLLYYTLFDVLGAPLQEVIQEVFLTEKPTLSQRTCLMIFACKPGKLSSKLLKDKRKISLLNADFKVLTGIENDRHTRIVHRTVSPLQFALGKDKRIHHAIALARDAINAASKRKDGSAICDLDFKSAFDLLCMSWAYKVLKAKGLHPKVIERIERYYDDSFTIPVINNVMGKKLKT